MACIDCTTKAGFPSARHFPCKHELSATSADIERIEQKLDKLIAFFEATAEGKEIK